MDNKRWWKEAVVYQVYPRSFRDSNGDGIGDLPGITDKLTYIKKLGADVIWLSPCYRSPGVDNGYDISDYQDINPEYGTMADFKALLSRAHSMGLKIVMDLVVNHTSNEHPWFKEGRKSRDNPYHDYYIWRDEPNNWMAHFGGPAWDYNEATGEYYLHLFTPEQPDLNWENPKVRAAVFDMINFWLDMGVDGFRMDTVNMYSKYPGLPNLKTPGLASQYFLNGPHIHEYLREMHERCFQGKDVFTVGEAPGVSPALALSYVAPERRELNMIFQFEHMWLDCGSPKWERAPYRPMLIMDNLTKWQVELDGRGWNSLYLSNHDQPRQVSRFGDDGSYWAHSAKMLATLIHMQQGTPYIYQGEEIGMTNCPFEDGEYRDIETINALAEFKGMREGIARMSRDNARTPMQWDASQNAGFTTGRPWIKANPNYVDINAAAQEDDPGSVLNYYRALTGLRREHKTIVYGSFERAIEDEHVFAFRRVYDERLFVALNMTGQEAEIKLPEGETLLSNYGQKPGKTLMPYEAAVIKEA